MGIASHDFSQVRYGLMSLVALIYSRSLHFVGGGLYSGKFSVQCFFSMVFYKGRVPRRLPLPLLRLLSLYPTVKPHDWELLGGEVQQPWHLSTPHSIWRRTSMPGKRAPEVTHEGVAARRVQGKN